MMFFVISGASCNILVATGSEANAMAFARASRTDMLSVWKAPVDGSTIDTGAVFRHGVPLAVTRLEYERAPHSYAGVPVLED